MFRYRRARVQSPVFAQRTRQTRIAHVPQRDSKEGAGSSGLVARIPAAELEAAVLSQLQHIIRAPILAVEIEERAKKHDSDIDEAKVTVALTQFQQVWA